MRHCFGAMWSSLFISVSSANAYVGAVVSSSFHARVITSSVDCVTLIDPPPVDVAATYTFRGHIQICLRILGIEVRGLFKNGDSLFLVVNQFMVVSISQPTYQANIVARLADDFYVRQWWCFHFFDDRSYLASIRPSQEYNPSKSRCYFPWFLIVFSVLVSSVSFNRTDYGVYWSNGQSGFYNSLSFLSTLLNSNGCSISKLYWFQL